MKYLQSPYCGRTIEFGVWSGGGNCVVGGDAHPPTKPKIKFVHLQVMLSKIMSEILYNRIQNASQIIGQVWMLA